jgi:uncharacterized lipoprotein YddW (UPF0748 family)
MREFRAAWVATVNNIDWPSKKGLPVSQQKAEILRILDLSVKLHLNAIVLQVRPACDAFYPSKLEPWSEYLTGRMGEAPSPRYDPLEMWVEEAHKRGIELHAWFNPYRAHHPTGTSPISDDHVSKKNPSIVRTYGSHLWLDPGEKGTQDHSLNVIMDVVKHYDIDGVHMDDYFYPYKEKDKAGNIIEFPDDHSYQKYRNDGGTLGRDDWRRENVNTFIERLYKEIKKTRPSVRFGVSPFGIWRPGNPSQIKGFDQYSELYADARKWLREGWVDYWTPQLYWAVSSPGQSYPVLLKWWQEQNTHHRNLWPGNYTSRITGGSSAWKPSEIVEQIEVTRRQPGATGNVHFSMITLLNNTAGISDALRSVYAKPALVPGCPWLDNTPPGKPKLELFPDRSAGEVRAEWKQTGREKPWLWVLQTKVGSQWYTEIIPGARSSYILKSGSSGPETVAVSAVDRLGNQSEPIIAAVK